MIAVLSVGESLTSVMSGAAATTNPTYAALWRESLASLPNQPVGSLSGATAVTIVSAPTHSQRLVELLQIFNSDSAAVTITVSKVVSGTSYTLAKATLQAGDSL